MAKVKLHAMPMTLGGATVLAIHTPWALNPLYSLAEIIKVTPGATYTLATYRADMGPPVSLTDAYWRGDSLSASTAWGILTSRLRQLRKIPADSFPELPTSFTTQAETNRQATLKLVTGSGRDNWDTLKTGLAELVEYDGAVRVPVWLSEANPNMT